jgi:uncharacterized protein (TIGR00255 family)
MIRSMTGFGKASGEFSGKIISVEVKSLNSKFLEFSLRLPSIYKDKDLELRSELSKIIERGKADISIIIEHGPGAATNTLNTEVIKAYYNELKNIGAEAGTTSENLLSSILHLPFVVNTDKGIPSEEEWNFIQSLMRDALKAFTGYRETEGKTIFKDLSGRILTIETLLTKLEGFEKERMGNVKARLLKNLETVNTNIEYDKNRFEQELIYYLEKLDISEEKSRLRSHCTYFIQTINSKENNGKKLGFITQEIGREINTIGSKANDADMQRLVVEMKDEAEKLKEQLSNVL